MTSAIPDLSADLLFAVRSGDREGAGRLVADIHGLDPWGLAESLSSDAARIATWLNLYNAATQRMVEADPVSCAHRFRFFRRPAIVVAGQTLSLDAIEHGLLRRSRWKVGLGWLGNPVPSRFERRHRVDIVDPRIHFALNCAAASCPPIAAYDAARLDAQLDLVTRSFLAAAVHRQGDRLVVPRILLWFMGDFGGLRGVRRFLADHGTDPGAARLRFARFDWSPLPAAWAPPEGMPGSTDHTGERDPDTDPVAGSTP